MAITPEQIARQKELEQEMLGATRELNRAATEKRRAHGTEDETVYGKRMVQAAIQPLADTIDAALAEVRAGKSGRHHKALGYLDLLPPEVTAYIAIRTTLQRISAEVTVTRVCVAIGDRIEDEVRFRLLTKDDPKMVERLLKLTAKATTYKHKQAVLSAVATKEGHHHEAFWSDEEKMHVGLWLLDRLRDTTGFVAIETRGTGRSKATYLTASEACLKWIEGCAEANELLAPRWWPTIIPPRRWKGVYGGGYWGKLPRPLCMLKVRGADGYMQELANTDLSLVHAAMNAVQDTPYRVARFTLEAVRHAQALGLSIKGIPSVPPAEQAPPKPADIDTNEEARKEYRKAAAAWWQDRAASSSKAVQLASVLRQAERFLDEDRFYLPVQLDFRGRLYYLPLLSPQGPKLARGLLQAADAKPITTEEQADWLRVHVANTYGYDKDSFEGRVAWVKEREQRIIQAGTDPWADQWWTEADSPWEFLTACHDYAGLMAHGLGYESRCLVYMDGTCNGLQHLSAMLLDEVGGAAVNLVPGEKPSDIYGKVWATTEGYLREIASLQGEDAVWARKWLAVGGNRTTVKRIVMCLPYGLGQFSAKAYLLEAVKEQLAKRSDKPFAFVKEDGTETDGVMAAVNWLCPHVWKAIGETVVAAKLAMEWMQKWASAVASTGLPVSWVTPDGLPVQQRYRLDQSKRIDTVLLGGMRFTGTVALETDEIDTRAQRGGIAPNFTHSLDGAAMRGYVRQAIHHGISAFALVHDSYGCHAADVPQMQAALRQAFVDMYETTDVLDRLREDLLPLVDEKALAKLPALPPKGSLDLRAVLESKFFFA